MTEQREDGGSRGAAEAGPVPLRAAYWSPELVLLAARVAQMGYGPKAGEDAIPRDFPRSRFLATRRLSLRELGYEDVRAITDLGEDDRVHAALVDDRIRSLVEIVTFIAWANQMYRERPGLGIWRADADSGRFIGLFSLVPIAGGDEVEIGTRLLPCAWGRGYALEGGAALCTHAFTTAGLGRLVGLCHPENRSVPPLLERLGFQADGVTTHFGKHALRFVLEKGAWNGAIPRRRRNQEPVLAHARVFG
jgi:RimJ/RimL family protein N-acetyltransferase